VTPPVHTRNTAAQRAAIMQGVIAPLGAPRGDDDV
jgi:hypothetical protein